MSFPKNVLLIDDDPEDCEIFFTALKERFDGVECNYEQDARAALKRIYDTTIPAPQMVFLDWRMPLISGAEILTIIRELPHYKGIPIVIFSGGLANYWEEAQKLGASYLLVKPSKIDELIVDLTHIFELESKRKSN